MQDISVFGLQVRLVASLTFPQGITITQFADDQDPLDFPSTQIGDKGMGVNGDMVGWAVATPIEVPLSIIPGSEDNKNLAVLFDANRAARGKRVVRDVLTMTVMYPDGSTRTLSGGMITDGTPAQGAQSSGRKKTQTYTFAFENMVGTD